ncbi:amidase signature domain-containing protein [Hypoxylon sp. NC1633]|nr:amidase signature domain-containing protein [Hypoxylon sp. NC1633]
MDPEGSSSGSGVSSVLGLALAALGTETDGSIVCPSQRENLAGVKPAAVAGYDPKDNYTKAIPDCGKIPDYLAALEVNSPNGARIGVPYNILPTANSTDLASYYNAIEVMKAAGAAANFLNANASPNPIVLQADFISNLASYLAELKYMPNNVKSLADAREFTQTLASEEYPDRDTAIWNSALALGYNNSVPRFWEVLQQNYYNGGEAGLLDAIERNNVDAIILPTTRAPTLSAIMGTPIRRLRFYPDGAPVAMTTRGLVTTAPNVPSPRPLIKLAYVFEQETMVRNKVQPYLVPTTEFGDIVGF